MKRKDGLVEPIEEGPHVGGGRAALQSAHDVAAVFVDLRRRVPVAQEDPVQGVDTDPLALAQTEGAHGVRERRVPGAGPGGDGRVLRHARGKPPGDTTFSVFAGSPSTVTSTTPLACHSRSA